MEDKQIVDLFWQRDEQAVAEAARKYGHYCYSIAYRILGNAMDADECVNDTYQGAWSSIPPHRPEDLGTYLGKITRRVSLKSLRSKAAQRRGGGEVALSLDELSGCVPAVGKVDDGVEFQELVDILNRFLSDLALEERRVFVRRYWHVCSISEICDQYGYSKSKVESMLHRTRKKLRNLLKKEGYIV